MDKSILDELTELLKKVKEPSCLILRPESGKMEIYEVPFKVVDIAMKMYSLEKKNDKNFWDILNNQKNIEPVYVDIVNKDFWNLL